MHIVITGASRGIGKAIAEQFAAKGHTIYLCARGKAGLIETQDELIRRFPSATIKAKAADLSVRSELNDFGDWVLSSGVPDILVNNAGQFIPGSIHSEAEGIFEKMLQANLFSAYHLTRFLLPEMMKRHSGHIFNICSIASIQAYENGGSYSISKFALLGLTRNLREEMKPHGIKVTAVMPGAAYTSSWEGVEIAPERIMTASDIAIMIEAASRLSLQACVEDIVLRPLKGDL